MKMSKRNKQKGLKGTYSLLVVLLLLFTGCSTKQPAIQMVPIKEVTTAEVETLEIPADSTELRLLIECLPNGLPKITQTDSATPSNIRLNWSLRDNNLNLKALVPPSRVQYLTRTITREVPVEVVQEVKVNQMYLWQKALMAIGLITCLYCLYGVVKIILRIR